MAKECMTCQKLCNPLKKGRNVIRGLLYNDGIIIGSVNPRPNSKFH